MRPIMSLIDIPSDARVGKPPCGECHLKVGETCDICGAKQAFKSTAAMRARARELATAGSTMDDYDRAVLAILDDFDALLNR